MDATIRRATRRDARRITTLIHSSSAYHGQYASILWDYRVTGEYLDRHEVFVATDRGGRLLGFYALLLDPPELDLAFVADDAQGSGLGRALIEHMIAQAHAAGLPTVRVVSHPPAEMFYRRLGAERIGTVAARPPAVPWERPELEFRIHAAEAPPQS
ncbi:GNAT family N-acetyltransferase [Phytoactinopolyspora mesophila]|uniref:GNAT family N-acetyltransferase n=1 Tax=Phytoactinopolyspora mesophila TaxID=2650750 RepID=A0A7K3M239_9ACTN|nr:GNAT family N-acetyltransferase [Phytoactinopolyspora mesophila]